MSPRQEERNEVKAMATGCRSSYFQKDKRWIIYQQKLKYLPKDNWTQTNLEAKPFAIVASTAQRNLSWEQRGHHSHRSKLWGKTTINGTRDGFKIGIWMQRRRKQENMHRQIYSRSITRSNLFQLAYLTEESQQWNIGERLKYQEASHILVNPVDSLEDAESVLQHCQQENGKNYMTEFLGINLVCKRNWIVCHGSTLNKRVISIDWRLEHFMHKA